MGQYRVSYRGSNGFQLGPIGYIIGINVVLLIASLVSNNVNVYLGLPANLEPQGFLSGNIMYITARGFLDQPWSIITHMFVHGGMWHLFTNMLTLFFFGNYLLRLVGSRKFLIIYFIAGIIGGAAYMWLADAGIAVGASGAVFGVAGALAVLRPKLKVFIIPIPVPIPLWVAVLFGFGLLSLPFVAGNIAWQAHLGGLLVGLIAGWLLRRRTYPVFY